MGRVSVPDPNGPRAVTLAFDAAGFTIDLEDGRTLRVPSLAAADPAARENSILIGGGHGIHWPDLDEDISVEGLLAGRRARAPCIMGSLLRGG